MPKEIFYICPECRDLVTQKDLLNACGNGGLPLCYCEFISNSVLIEYKRISKELWSKLQKSNHLPKQLKLK